MTLKLKGILKNTTKQLGHIITAQAIIECKFHSRILCFACVSRCCFYLATLRLINYRILDNIKAPRSIKSYCTYTHYNAIKDIYNLAMFIFE